MCIFTSEAHAENTIVYGGEIQHPEHGYVHTVAYQNTVTNHSPGANSIILHVPSAEPLGRENLIDTRSGKNVFKDMVRALTPVDRSAMYSLGNLTKGGYEIFSYDVYDIIVAHDAEAIPVALQSDLIQENRRPTMSPHLARFFSLGFPGWGFVIGLFDQKDARDAAPFFWWYKPLFENQFRAPAIDSHDGNVPNFRTDVLVDHWFILGSDQMRAGAGVPMRYTDNVSPKLSEFLPKRVIGKKYTGFMKNGDFGAQVLPVRSGKAEVERLLPAVY